MLDQPLAAQPRQRLFVDDLDQHPEEAIAGRDMTPLAKLTLLCLKVLRHADPDDVPRFFDRWQHLLQAIGRTEGAPEAHPRRLRSAPTRSTPSAGMLSPSPTSIRGP